MYPITYMTSRHQAPLFSVTFYYLPVVLDVNKEPDSGEENSSNEDTHSSKKKQKRSRVDSLESKLPLSVEDVRFNEVLDRGKAEVKSARKNVEVEEKEETSSLSHSEKIPKKKEKEQKNKKKHRRSRTPVRTPEGEKNVQEVDRTTPKDVTEETAVKGEDRSVDTEHQRRKKKEKIDAESKHFDSNNSRTTRDLEERPPSEDRVNEMENWDQTPEDVGPRSPQISYREERRRDWEGDGAEKSKRRKSPREESPRSQQEIGPRSPRKPYREERRRDWEGDDFGRSKRRRSQQEESPPPPPPPPPPPYEVERAAPSLDGRQDDRGAPPPPSRPPYDVGQGSSVAFDGNGLVRPSSHGASPVTHSPTLPTVGTLKPPVPPMPLPTTLQLDTPPGPTHSPGCIPIGTGGVLPPAPVTPSNPDILLELLRRYPVVWQGLLALKNDTAAVQMHYLAGNARLAELSLPQLPLPGMSSVPPPIRIAQRMRLEPSQLDGVIRRMQV